MSCAPIALFVYKRPETTKAAVTALLRNPEAQESIVHVFADGPKAGAPRADREGILQVRDYIAGIQGFAGVVVHESPVNKGLAASIIQGVSTVLAGHPSVIVVEDDLVVSRHFLAYMNGGLRLYADDDPVISIHGYVPPSPSPLPETFFIKGADCWGWATWAQSWALFEPDGTKLLAEILRQGKEKAFDMDGCFPYTRMLAAQAAGQVDSWAIRWYASAFLQDKLTLYPGKTLVRNIGFSADATNTKMGLASRPQGLATGRLAVERLPLYEDPTVRRIYCEALR